MEGGRDEGSGRDEERNEGRVGGTKGVEGMKGGWEGRREWRKQIVGPALC